MSGTWRDYEEIVMKEEGVVCEHSELDGVPEKC